MRRGQEFVDFLGNEGVDGLPGLAALHAGGIYQDGGGVLTAKGTDLIRHGRQADQIIMDTA